MSKLIECEYLTENDYDYLRNDEEWIERMRAKALNDYEVSQLKKLMLDLKTCGMAHINDMFAVGPLKFYFNKQDFTHSARNASGLQGTASQDKFQVKAAFIATIIRFLILKEHADQLQLSQNYPEVSASCDRLTFLGKYPFLEQEYGTSIELTWLNRFERSLRYLKRFVPPERNKILYLTVGNHLEGSTLYTTYITGGANRPETERRVRIFDSLCQVAPRKRTRKPEQSTGATIAGAAGGDSSSAAPGLGLGLMTTAAIAYEGNQSKTKQENYSKKKQRGTATTAGVTAGGGVLPSSRSFSSFPPAISLARSHSYTAPSPPFPFQYQQFQFPPAFHLSRQTSSASFQSDVTSSSSDNIPYELSVLLAAVESQIKADAIDLDDDEDKVHQEQEEQEQENDRINCKNDNDHNEYSLTICPSSSDLTTGSFSSSTNNNNNEEKKNNNTSTNNNKNNKKKEQEQLPMRPSSSSASSSQDLEEEEEEEEEDTTDTPSSLSSPSQNGVPLLLPRRSFSTSSMNAALASTSIQQPPTNNNSSNGTDPSSSHNYGTRNRSFSANNNIMINNNNKISV
jgi:hypothetical protein